MGGLHIAVKDAPERAWNGRYSTKQMHVVSVARRESSLIRDVRASALGARICQLSVRMFLSFRGSFVRHFEVNSLSKFEINWGRRLRVATG